jgi:hypothetical protein
MLGLGQLSRITDCANDGQSPHVPLEFRAYADLGALQNLPATHTSASIDRLTRP